jgi:sugar phosphate isomerase/epimerase
MKSRRSFLKSGTLGAGCVILSGAVPDGLFGAERGKYDFGVHQYSLRPLFDSGELSLKDLPRFAKEELGVTNIEFTADLCEEFLNDDRLVEIVRNETERVGAKNHAILSAAEPALDASELEARDMAIREHLGWARIADRLACRYIRVRASSEGDREVQLSNAIDGLGRLCTAISDMSVDVLVENIAGHSRDADWLVELAQRIGSDRIGILADFGNFEGDLYAGMEKLLPLTKSLCAKSWDFDASGEETAIDYGRMMKLIQASGFEGCISVEYLGKKIPPAEGVRKTKELILSCL